MSVRPSVRPSTKSFFDLSEIWHVGTGRRVMHDGMQYDPIQGQGQGHQGRNNRVGKVGKVQGAPEPRGPRVSGKKYGDGPPFRRAAIPGVRHFGPPLILVNRPL